MILFGDVFIFYAYVPQHLPLKGTPMFEDYYSKYDDHLIGWIWMTAAVGCLCAKVIDLAFNRYTDIRFKAIITQRSRYSLTATAGIASMIMAGVPLYNVGYSGYMKTLQSLRRASTPFGWAVTFGAWFALLMPVACMVTATFIYFMPAPLAKKVSKGRYETIEGYQVGGEAAKLLSTGQVSVRDL